MHSGMYVNGVAIGAGANFGQISTDGMSNVSFSGTSSVATVITAQGSEDGTNFINTANATASGTVHNLTFTTGFRYVRFTASIAATITAVIGASGGDN